MRLGVWPQAATQAPASARACLQAPATSACFTPTMHQSAALPGSIRAGACATAAPKAPGSPNRPCAGRLNTPLHQPRMHAGSGASQQQCAVEAPANTWDEKGAPAAGARQCHEARRRASQNNPGPLSRWRPAASRQLPPPPRAALRPPSRQPWEPHPLRPAPPGSQGFYDQGLGPASC